MNKVIGVLNNLVDRFAEMYVIVGQRAGLEESLVCLLVEDGGIGCVPRSEDQGRGI